MAVALAVVTVALGSLPFLGTEFMPRLDEGSILIETRKLPSVSLDESVAISTRVEQILRRASPRSPQVVTKIGRPDLATEAMGIYQGDVYVLPAPARTRGRAAATKERADRRAWPRRSRDDARASPCNFTQPMAMRLDEVVSGVKADVAVKVFGPDAAVLERIGARGAGASLERVRGAADAAGRGALGRGPGRRSTSIATRSPATACNVADVQRGRRDRGRRRDGHRAARRRRGASTSWCGCPDEVRGRPRGASAACSLTAPGGERVPLGERRGGAHRVRRPRPSTTRTAERRLVVQTNVRGRDVGSFVAEAQRRLAAAVTLPAGYYVDVGRAVREPAARHARGSRVVVPLSLAIIFLLLLRHVRHACGRRCSSS